MEISNFVSCDVKDNTNHPYQQVASCLDLITSVQRLRTEQLTHRVTEVSEGSANLSSVEDWHSLQYHTITQQYRGKNIVYIRIQN